MNNPTYGKNFIKPLPESHNAAVDESLMMLQVRVRKGTNWEKALRTWLDSLEEIE